MRVIYKETIVDKIQKLLHKDDRPIEKIIVTQAEWDELIKYTCVHTSPDGDSYVFCGVVVEKEKPLIVDVLRVFSTYQRAKYEFENLKEWSHVSYVNNRDLVLMAGNRRIKYAVVVSMQDYDKFAGRFYDEIYFDEYVDEWTKTGLMLNCLKKYHV